MAYPNFYSAPNNFQAPQQPQYQQPVAQSGHGNHLHVH